MMGNLDKKEIEMLDGKYLKMMDEINAIILSRLLNSSIPFNASSLLNSGTKTISPGMSATTPLCLGTPNLLGNGERK